MISWTYYYLSFYPECLAKMKAEHVEVFGSDTDETRIAQQIITNPSILGKLEYTLAALKETLRLCPIGDGVRYASRGYIVRTETGVEFDTTDMILNIQHSGLHKREAYWGPQATEFDPERFMVGKQIPIGYMPFATRPRDCIGRNLAYLEVTTEYIKSKNRGKSHWHLQFAVLSSNGSRSYIKFSRARCDRIYLATNFF
jgi:cytochrome P450